MNKIGYTSGILSGLFWALAGIFYVKVTDRVIDSSYFVFILLFCIEFIPWLFLTLLILFLKKEVVFKIKLVFPFFAGLLAGPVAMYCYLNAILLIGLSFSASITSLYPVFAIFLAFIFLKQKINIQGFFGLLLALISLFLLFFNGLSFNFFGIILAIICALSWGTELVLSSIVLKELSTTSVYYARQTGASFGYAVLILTQEPNFAFDDILSFDFIVLLLCAVSFWGLSYFLYYFTISKIGLIKAMMLNISYVIWLVIIQSEFDFKQIALIFLVFIGANLVLFSKKDKD
ncbi:DMT family transporter [Campylobacter lari]|uniref:DMT family transporter n=1 Tax=Campylobacter lari TaxID=201 RepID=UPI00214A1E3B|nr:DMT family transporter [Campylobacter lari]MCR2068598.1 DMT family transporter [Campylobacter lari subsp. concheus]